jgi:hypothetical protein
MTKNDQERNVVSLDAILNELSDENVELVVAGGKIKIIKQIVKIVFEWIGYLLVAKEVIEEVYEYVEEPDYSNHC